MSDLHIGVFLGENIPSYWAHSFNVMKMAQGFKSIGCQVEVVTAENVNSLRLKKEIKDVYTHYGVNSSIPITFLAPSKEAFLSGKTRYDSQFCQRACQYAKEKQFDFVYCRNHLLAYHTAIEGIPTFLEGHHTNYDEPVRKKIYEVAHFDSFKGFITIHDDIKREYVKRGMPTNKILVLEDGVDLNRFDLSDDKYLWREKLGFDKEKKYAVYCGHLYPEKGIEVILNVADKFQQHKDIVFLLVGGLEKDRRKWEEYCLKKGIKNVLFTGFIPNSDVPKYLKVADCLLLAYKLKDINYKVMDINTTSPLKLFEYMASKRPIAATNIPTISKVLNHNSNSLLVRPDDIEDYCKAIHNLLQDHQLSKRLAHKAYVDVEKFSWDNRCKEIIQLFLGS